MSRQFPRPSTSETLLEHGLEYAKTKHSAETKLIRVRDLTIRHCEGYYSRALKGCTWPCNITKQDPTDEMKVIYDGVVDWADAVIVATPLRWGNASALYYEMVQPAAKMESNTLLARCSCSGLNSDSCSVDFRS